MKFGFSVAFFQLNPCSTPTRIEFWSCLYWMRQYRLRDIGCILGTLITNTHLHALAVPFEVLSYSTTPGLPLNAELVTGRLQHAYSGWKGLLTPIVI
jgi:hypothetical protein